MKKDNMHNKNLGYAAENIAKRYYEKKGWASVAQNETERGSELDLVLEKTKPKTPPDPLSQLRQDYAGQAQGGEQINITREILFVEVKSVEIDAGGKMGRDNIRPEDNFTKSKQKYFKRGIELYLAKNKLNQENINIRTDLACVYHHSSKLKEEQWTIKVYENIILD